MRKLRGPTGSSKITSGTQESHDQFVVHVCKRYATNTMRRPNLLNARPCK